MARRKGSTASSSSEMIGEATNAANVHRGTPTTATAYYLAHRRTWVAASCYASDFRPCLGRVAESSMSVVWARARQRRSPGEVLGVRSQQVECVNVGVRAQVSRMRQAATCGFYPPLWTMGWAGALANIVCGGSTRFPRSLHRSPLCSRIMNNKTAEY
eukprot:scaffold263190_cov31-Tisochrysis_lutea.AAC.3